MDFHSDKDTWSPGNPIRYCWFFRDIEWFQQTDDVPVWAINLGAEIGGRWTALIEQNFSQNAARIFTKIRLIERNVPPTQQYLFLVDLLDWVGTSSDIGIWLPQGTDQYTAQSAHILGRVYAYN
ncbi:hypothetical protein K474DRAFT_1709504 [Panus rudis PR-1116 ss-1]|nr:hypothetical protein K474DRAFT_1709504 [Panus rudis PR-1116 ss-1]